LVAHQEGHPTCEKSQKCTKCLANGHRQGQEGGEPTALPELSVRGVAWKDREERVGKGKKRKGEERSPYHQFLDPPVRRTVYAIVRPLSTVETLVAD